MDADGKLSGNEVYIDPSAGLYTIDGGNYLGSSVQPNMSGSGTIQIVTRNIIMNRLDFRHASGIHTVLDFNDFNDFNDFIFGCQG